jgi:crotonobetainyl-CoA:carnitine CoA-transferase CaiB-like acyl-CoA transferase
LVYCHTRGFEKGPREPLPGNDQTGSALSGVQWEDGACNSGAGRPYWSLTSFGDTGNGYLATNGIIQALRIRETTGAGQFVDTSIVNAQLYNCSHIIARNDGTGFERPILREDAFGYSAGYRLYNTDAGYICLAAILPAHWEALFEAIEDPRFAKDKRFASTESRQLNDAALNDFLSTAFLRKTAAEWVELLTRCGVPSEVSNADYSKTVWQDESESFLLERQWLVNWPHPVAGQLGHVGVPYSLSKTPAVPQCGPLIVGEYTREILTDLGYSSEQQAQLFEADVVADESCYGYDIALPQETA